MTRSHRSSRFTAQAQADPALVAAFVVAALVAALVVLLEAVAVAKSTAQAQAHTNPTAPPNCCSIVEAIHAIVDSAKRYVSHED